MKSAEQIFSDHTTTTDGGTVAREIQWIRSIQADAINHAAEYASCVTTCGGGSQKIAAMLRAEAMRVQAGHPLRPLPPPRP